eukprot:14516333-Alexandrium_andersonii.AAC.1
MAHEEIAHVKQDLLHDAPVLSAPPPAGAQEGPGELAGGKPRGDRAPPAQWRIVESVYRDEQLQHTPPRKCCRRCVASEHSARRPA